MIVATIWEIDGSYTAERGVMYHVECEVDGVKYEVDNRGGPTSALARVLKDAGLPDDELVTQNREGKRLLYWKSFHRAAGYTYVESAKTALRMGKFVPIADRMGGAAE